MNAHTDLLFRSIRSFRNLLSGPAFNCLYYILFSSAEYLSTRYGLVNHFETLQSGHKRTLYRNSRKYFLHENFILRFNLPLILYFSWNLLLWLHTLQPLVSLQRLISTSPSTFLGTAFLLNAIYLTHSVDLFQSAYWVLMYNVRTNNQALFLSVLPWPFWFILSYLSSPRALIKPPSVEVQSLYRRLVSVENTVNQDEPLRQIIIDSSQLLMFYSGKSANCV